MFNASKRSYGPPRVHADLLEAGWTVSVNTVADSMRRQGTCPCCEEMITVEELTTDAVPSALARGQHTHPSLKKPPRFEGKLNVQPNDVVDDGQS